MLREKVRLKAHHGTAVTIDGVIYSSILYVRDRKEIVALDLGPAPAKPEALVKPEEPAKPETAALEVPAPETKPR